MSNEIINNIKVLINERVANPLVSNFSISWVVWNYKIFIVFFSSGTLVQKFSFMKNNIFQTPGDVLLFGFIFPLLTTIIYIYVIPFFSKKVYVKWKNDQDELIALKQKIEGDQLLTLEKSIALKQECIKLRNQYVEDLKVMEENYLHYKNLYTEENKTLDALQIEYQNALDINKELKVNNEDSIDLDVEGMKSELQTKTTELLQLKEEMKSSDSNGKETTKDYDIKEFNKKLKAMEVIIEHTSDVNKELLESNKVDLSYLKRIDSIVMKDSDILNEEEEELLRVLIDNKFMFPTKRNKWIFINKTKYTFNELTIIEDIYFGHNRYQSYNESINRISEVLNLDRYQAKKILKHLTEYEILKIQGEHYFVPEPTKKLLSSLFI